MRWKLQAFAAAFVSLCLGSAPASADTPLVYITGYAEPGATADGTPVGPNVAACPPDWAFGTVVRVQLADGPHTIVCHDRYSALLSPRIDLWWPTPADCFAHTGYFPVTFG